MGTTLGWHRESGGSGESFKCGGGMMWFNEPEVVEAAHDGSFGPAMRSLIGDGIPSGWTVFRENVFYRCPECDAIIPGGSITIDDRSGGWLVFYTEPEECPRCNEDLVMRDVKVPITENELFARCMSYMKGGCPECEERSRSKRSTGIRAYSYPASYARTVECVHVRKTPPAGHIRAHALREAGVHDGATVFTNESGTIKSTLPEAIAVAYGFSQEGDMLFFAHSSYDDVSELFDALTLARGLSRPRWDQYLRAESLYNVATLVNTEHRGGRVSLLDMHAMSYGEDFLAYLRHAPNRGFLIYMSMPTQAQANGENRTRRQRPRHAQV